MRLPVDVAGIEVEEVAEVFGVGVFLPPVTSR